MTTSNLQKTSNFEPQTTLGTSVLVTVVELEDLKFFGTVAKWHSGQKLPRSAANVRWLRGLSNLIGLVASNRFRSNDAQFLIQKPIRRQSLFGSWKLEVGSSIR